MTLVRTTLLNSIAVGVKMLTLLGINKMLAIYVGPAGYAALGQFQNVVQMITTCASGSINTGVTKYTAEYHYDETRQHTLWRTASTIALVASLLIAVLTAIFSESLAGWFLKDKSLGSVFRWFAATLVFFTFNALLLAILNGKKEISRYVAANIAGSLLALVVTAVMVWHLGVYGALVALVVYQSLTFIVTAALCHRASWFSFGKLLGSIDYSIARNLAKYAAMALVSAVCVPVSHILARNHLGETFGWQTAGYWEAMWRLSGAYLVLATSMLGVYYLPRFSELNEPEELKNEIVRGYKFILPLAAAGGLIMYQFRDMIIQALFASDFTPMRELFGWQMIGDTLRIGSWIIAYVMLGRAMTKAFLLTEVISSASFVGFVYLFTDILGWRGIVVAYAVNYLVYWVAVGLVINYTMSADRVR